MQARTRTFVVIGLMAALAAGAALSAPARPPGGDALTPPTAAELGLAGAQAQRWDALSAEARALRRVGRDTLRTGMTELRGALERPDADLRDVSAESQRRVDAHLAETRALRERQLAFYESLPPEQQARVRAALAQRLDRLAQLRERLHRFTDTGA